jgi:3',5'-cyclic-AMP phosphodiesterase
MTPNTSLLVAQITDVHLYAAPETKLMGLPTWESFQAVIRMVKELPLLPDLFVLTGDLSQDVSVESYQHLWNALSPFDRPTYWLPGNHDEDIPRMEQVLNHPPFSAQKSFQAGQWQIILLNSAVPNCVHGELSTMELEWLDDQLQKANNRPTLVAIHHPPLLIDSAWMDAIGLKKADDFLAVLDRHAHAKLVLCGHIHQEFEAERAGVHYLGTPSSCVQFKPNSDRFALDETRPGFRLLTLHPNGEWETEVHRATIDYDCDANATGY